MSDTDDLDPLLFLMLQDDENGLSNSERERLLNLRALLERRHGGPQQFAEVRSRWERGEETSDPEFGELCMLEARAIEGGG